MITFKELLGDNSLSEVPIAHQQNLEKLLQAMNAVRNAYGKPMIVTSGYRSEQHHRNIYMQKMGPLAKVPMGSKHLSGLACDILDNTGELYKWCKANNDTLEKAGVWLEERQGNWQHFQIVPFKSYKPGKTRWFNP